MESITTSASGADIHAVLTAMEPILTRFPEEQVFMACLALSFIILKPDLSSPEMKMAVYEVSRWMANYLNTAELSKLNLPGE